MSGDGLLALRAGGSRVSVEAERVVVPASPLQVEFVTVTHLVRLQRLACEIRNAAEERFVLDGGSEHDLEQAERLLLLVGSLAVSLTG